MAKLFTGAKPKRPAKIGRELDRLISDAKLDLTDRRYHHLPRRRVRPDLVPVSENLVIIPPKVCGITLGVVSIYTLAKQAGSAERRHD